MPKTSAMGSFWDAKARENATYFIHNLLDYRHPDEEDFWLSGPANLDQTLAPFGRSIRSEDRVVEIGCGIGRITRALAARAAHVTGIDVSAEMVARGLGALSDLANVGYSWGTVTTWGAYPTPAPTWSIPSSCSSTFRTR